MAFWARARANESDARPRIVVQASGVPIGAWIDRLSTRADVAIERVDSAAPLIRAARGARLVALVAPFPLPAGASDVIAVKIREIRAELPKTGSVVVLQGPESAEDAPIAQAREMLFAAGAGDVIVLPADSERLEEALGQAAGIGMRRYVRHRVRLTATATSGNRELTVNVENVSAGGLQLRMGSAPEPGSVWRIAIPLERRELLDVFAMVRNVATAGAGAVVRMRFVGMRAAERTKLESFLASLDPDTRSTEPADAIAGVRRLDATALRSALESPKDVPDWLAAALPAYTESEKRALGASSPGGVAATWSTIAVARTQAAALADALEKYDPTLDGDSVAVRESVLSVLRRVARAKSDLATLSGSAGEPDAPGVQKILGELADRLERATSARLPDLAAAWERTGGNAQSVAELGLAGDLTLRQSEPARLRRRLLAAGAGLMLGAAIVYAIMATLARTP